MKLSSEYEHFVQRLAEAGIPELDVAVGLLWYADHHEAGIEQTAKALADEMRSVRFNSGPNVSRLRMSLAMTRATVRGTKPGTFRIALPAKSMLDERFMPLLKRQKVPTSDDVIPDSLLKNTRPYLEQLAHEINGCFCYEFYDGCAVLCRRMVESLLVEAFDKTGHRSVIERDGHFVMLDEILSQAKSGNYIKLPRGTDRALEKVKEIGDTAAHDRYHITTKQDIGEFSSSFRRVISQLLGLAGIQASK